MATKRNAPPARDIACISIGFSDFLIDADSAMTVMKIFRKAVECRKDFNGHGYRYIAGHTPRLELSVVSASEVVMPSDAIALEDQR